MTLVTVPNPDAPPITHISSTPIDVSSGVDIIANGMISPLPIEKIPQPDQSQPQVEATVIKNMIPAYEKTNTIQEQNGFINALSGTIKNLAKDQDVEAAEYMSMLKDSNGTKLFENREEAMRFISRIRGMGGLKGLSRRELYNLRRKKNRRAIFLNTVNKTLPPEEITKVDGRYYVDTHPLPYMF